MTEIDDQELPELPYPDETPDITQAPPCIIYTTQGTFLVEDVHSWAYLTEGVPGVFASGKWSGVDEQRDVIIPFTSIQYISLDYAALDRYLDSPEAVSEDPGS